MGMMILGGARGWERRCEGGHCTNRKTFFIIWFFLVLATDFLSAHLVVYVMDEQLDTQYDCLSYLLIPSWTMSSFFSHLVTECNCFLP